jgi:hypothetical protein
MWLEAASRDVVLLISSLASLPCSGVDESLKPLQAFHSQLLEMLEATDSNASKVTAVGRLHSSGLPEEGQALQVCPSEAVTAEARAADAASAAADSWRNCDAMPAGGRGPVDVATGNAVVVASCMPERSSELTSGGETLATAAGPHWQPARAVIEADNGYTEGEAGRDARQIPRTEIAFQNLRLGSHAEAGLDCTSVGVPPVDASAADTDAASGRAGDSIVADVAATETGADNGRIADAAASELDTVHNAADGADRGQGEAGADVTAAAAVSQGF